MMKRTQFLSSATALGASVAGMTLPANSQTTPVRMIIFAGSDAWPLYVAREKGFFSRAGVDVTLTATPGSVPQMKRLMAGEFDLASTLLDNLVAYDEGQGDPSVAGPFDLFAFMGYNSGLLGLMVRPEITSYADLRGKRLAVDAILTGYTFVLRRVLDQQGVHEGDYSLVPVGSTDKRFEAMVSGDCAAALVASPFDILGQQKYGFKTLANAIKVLGHYQSTVVIARRSYAAANPAVPVSFIRGYRSALAWMDDPANRSEAISILTSSSTVPADLAARIAPALLNPGTGFARDGAFDPAGVAEVLKLRSDYGSPKKNLSDAAKYVDTSYLRRS
jgi:ABC-type nitrate/sulfonate/bicarbonate transport system substrate-binding protein